MTPEELNQAADRAMGPKTFPINQDDAIQMLLLDHGWIRTPCPFCSKDESLADTVCGGHRHLWKRAAVSDFVTALEAQVQDATKRVEETKEEVRSAWAAARHERNTLIECVRHYAYYEHSGSNRAKKTLQDLGL